MASHRKFWTPIRHFLWPGTKGTRLWLLFIAYGFLTAAVLGFLCIRFYDHYWMKEGKPRALTATKAPVSEAPQVNSRTSPASDLSSLIASKAQSRVFTNPRLVEHAHSQRTVLLNHSVSALGQVAFADASPAPSAQPQASATPTPYSTVKKPNFFKRLFSFILRALGVSVPSPPPQNGLQRLEFSSTNSTTPATNLTLRCSREAICAVQFGGYSSASQPTFRVTNGTIRSQRGIITWDLSNLKSGTYTAEMHTFDGSSFRRTVTVECFDCNAIQPTPTPTPTRMPTPVSTPSPVSSPRSTPTPVATPSPLSTPSPESTPTPMATPSPVATSSPRSIHTRQTTPAAKATPSLHPPTPTPTPPTPFASPNPTKETDYANKSWPEKLPKDWQSQITVEFRRTYGPTEYPTPSNQNGNISRPIVLPTIPGGEGNPDNELYEASASVEVPDTGDIEVLSKRDAEFKSLHGQRSVTWTIPFKQKNNVTERANFNVVFKVQLRNKRTGELRLTQYDLGQETIIVDWIPGARGYAYLLFVVFFPSFSFGMIHFSKKAQTSPAGRYVNAWLVDGQLPLIVDKTYQIGVNIGSLRENILGGREFTEPDWGAKTELELLIALNSLDAEVKPEWTTAFLPRYAEMEPVFFQVVPNKPEQISLSLSIYLKRDMCLLEKFCLRLRTARVAAVGTRKS